MAKMAYEEFGSLKLRMNWQKIHPPVELTPKDFVVSFMQTKNRFKKFNKSAGKSNSNVSKFSKKATKSGKTNMKKSSKAMFNKTLLKARMKTRIRAKTMMSTKG